MSIYNYKRYCNHVSDNNRKVAQERMESAKAKIFFGKSTRLLTFQSARKRCFCDITTASTNLSVPWIASQ